VGSSGTTAERFRDATADARSRPDRTSGMRQLREFVSGAHEQHAMDAEGRVICRRAHSWRDPAGKETAGHTM
jgi:hypothetical protein